MKSTQNTCSRKSSGQLGHLSGWEKIQAANKIYKSRRQERQAHYHGIFSLRGMMEFFLLFEILRRPESPIEQIERDLDKH